MKLKARKEEVHFRRRRLRTKFLRNCERVFLTAAAEGETFTRERWKKSLAKCAPWLHG